MVLSELQIALLGAGVSAVAVVWAYNAWQERKHRKAAEDIFKAGQGDALLGDTAAGVTEAADAESFHDAGIGERREPGLAAFDAPEERIEPRLPEADVTDATDATGTDTLAVEDAATAGVAADNSGVDAPAAEVVTAGGAGGAAEAVPAPAAAASASPSTPPSAAVRAAAPSPVLPGRWADEVADCIVRFVIAEPAEPVAVARLWAAQAAWAGELNRTLNWLARDERGWQPITSGEAGGSYREWAAALQLADRRGATSEGELARFFEGLQGLAAEFGARLELPPRGEVAAHAARLDQFCAAVDIQFALHIVEAGGGTFAGTKLRGVAEAIGMRLENDGVFRARDEEGSELYSLLNLGAEKLDAASLKSLVTQGFTLSLDVPRTAEGAPAFDRMLATARQLARTLGGVLVDAQRQPLAEPMIQGIRAKTIELQQQMRDAGIAPGSVRALRLFS